MPGALPQDDYAILQGASVVWQSHFEGFFIFRDIFDQMVKFAPNFFEDCFVVTLLAMTKINHFCSIKRS